MRRIFRIAGWIVLGLVVAFVMAFAWGRLRPRPAEVREALALMHEDRRPAHEHEVWPLIWLYDINVPVDRMDEVYRDEVAYFTAELTTGKGLAFRLLESPAEKKFGELPRIDVGEKARLCAPADRDCLLYAKENADVLTAILRKHAERLRRTRLILAGDDAWSTMPISPAMPFASGIGQNRLWFSDVALDFVQGRRTEGLRKACTDAAGWRRLHRHTNTLVTSLIFASYARQGGQLFAQLLSATSADEALPTECSEAFAPPIEADVDLCAAMRTEFAFMTASLDIGERESGAWDRLTGWLSFDTRQYEADVAMKLSPYCRRPSIEGPHVGKATTVPAETAHPDVFDWISNGAGNVLVKIAGPAYDEYAGRMQDYAASLRMLSTVLWLRETRNDGRPLAERFASRPLTMRVDGADDIVLSADGRSLSFTQRKPRSSEQAAVTVPLPPNL